MTVIADKATRCRLCGTPIAAGEEIQQIGRHSWGHPDCVERAQRR